MTAGPPPPAQHGDGPDRVVIGVATCNRPQRLTRLLASFAHLEPPVGADLQVLIVDNGGPDPDVDAVIDAYAAQSPWPVHRIREARRGIPFARNAILDGAMAQQARWVLMLDDDEAATPQWAAHMVDAMRRHGYALAGGPLRSEADHTPTGRVAASILATIQADTAGTNADRAQALANGAFPGHVWSNSCAIDLHMIGETKLRFDPACVRSGGSDVVFSEAVRDMGRPIGWVPEAVVIEYFSPDRLTMGHHMRLWRHLMHLDAAREALPPRAHLGKACRFAWDLMRHSVKAVFGRGPILDVARSAGRVAGSITAAFGARSTLYAPPKDTPPKAKAR